MDIEVWIIIVGVVLFAMMFLGDSAPEGTSRPDADVSPRKSSSSGMDEAVQRVHDQIRENYERGIAFERKSREEQRERDKARIEWSANYGKKK